MPSAQLWCENQTIHTQLTHVFEELINVVMPLNRECENKEKNNQKNYK